MLFLLINLQCQSSKEKRKQKNIYKTSNRHRQNKRS